MNTKLSEHITQLREHIAESTRRIAVAEEILASVELSEGVEFNFYGSTLWVTTSSREDVTKLLALAPAGQHWAKDRTGYDPSIPLKYICHINGVVLEIHVSGDAIPPTCKLQEIDVVIPAQPERIEKRRVLVCPEPAKPAPQEEPEDGEAERDEIPATHALESAAMSEAREIEKYGVHV